MTLLAQFSSRCNMVAPWPKMRGTRLGEIVEGTSSRELQIEEESNAPRRNWPLKGNKRAGLSGGKPKKSLRGV